MKRILIIAPLTLALLAQTVPAQQRSELQQTSGRLAGSILVGGRSLNYVEELTDKFGARLTGSAAYDRAAEWAAAQFRAAGIKNVRLEPFTVDHGWERGLARGRMITPMNRPLHIESLGWTISTPPAGVKGQVIWVSDISPAEIKTQTDRIKNRIVMLDLATIFAEGIRAYTRLMASYQLFKDAGAQAILWPDSTPGNLLKATQPNCGFQVPTLPIAQVGMEDTKLIRRLMEQGPVTIEFQYENEVTGPTGDYNVIAEIRGREKPDEWIIIGAHLDSWDYGTGAQDNGTGCAQVLEAARAIMALNQPPRRSIRFALWGGEEQCSMGSTAYVRAHSAELDNCVAALNTDNGAGQPRGWKVEGRDDLNKAMQPIGEELLANLNGDGLSEETSYDTDHGPFMLQGVPALDFWVNMSHYDDIHHKSSDTLDKVDRHNLALGAAIIAVTAYALAERPERIAPRLNNVRVGEILRKADLEGFLKDLGLWN
ncbi:MAG TPA: M20/M25/M40 family metallo-hydrolase [Pyrinomonadaceae bacterium]